MPKINFSQVKELEALPRGQYPCVFSEFKYNETSQASGQPYYACTFTVSHEVEEYAGRKLFLNLSMQAQSLWRFKQFAAQMGYDPNILESDTDMDTDEVLQDLIGQDCTLDVDTQMYQGKLSNTVKGIVEQTYGSFEPTPSGKRR